MNDKLQNQAAFTIKAVTGVWMFVVGLTFVTGIIPVIFMLHLMWKVTH